MFNAILLAAGLSSRLGILKQTLKLGGVRILDRSMAPLLTEVTQELIVVGGLFPLQPSRTDKRVQIIYHNQVHLGMGTSIRRGVEELFCTSIPLLIHLLDKPLLMPQTVEKLMEEFRQRKPLVLFPTFQGRRGHPVFFHENLYPQLKSLTGLGGKEILMKLEAEDILQVEVDDPGVVYDLDTWTDYLQLLILFGKG